MAVYVYDDYTKTRCLCVLEDDGRVYDRPDSAYDSCPRQVLGNIDYNRRVFYGKDRYDKAGAADYAGYVYNNMDNMCSAYKVGYVYEDKVYEDGPTISGYSPFSRPVAYMEGSGDMVAAGAAALLLVLGGGEKQINSSDSPDGYRGLDYYGLSGNSSSSSSDSGSTYSSSSDSDSSYDREPRRYVEPTPKKKGGPPYDAAEVGGCLFFVVIALIILEKLFG